MIRFIVFALLCTAAAAPAALAEDTSAEIRARCDAEWGTDYVMVRHCVDQQQEGLREVEEFLASRAGNEDAVDVAERCREEWSDRYGVDYQMLAHCVGRQWEAYLSLR